MTGESLGSILRRIKAQRETEGAEPAPQACNRRVRAIADVSLFGMQ